jgi:arylsulfatase A-like enzyme
MTKQRKISLSASLCAGFVLSAGMAATGAERPNIIYILTDDLGYGDVQCLNPEQGKIATPHMDQLAAEGMVFTDAHTSSSVCTPTRYGVLTGRYNWRSRLQSGVLFGFDQPLITPDHLTVPGFLKEQGYKTAMVGKWHLGLGVPTTDGKMTKGKSANNVDWKGRITGGPVDLGFDSWYGITASLDMPPFIFINNDHYVGECTTTKTFVRKGPAHADFEAVKVLSVFENKAAEYIQKQKSGEPFFMYIALTSPHAPIIPSSEWQGKSSLGQYGDFVMQTDSIVGGITDAVDAAGLAENTVIIVTSDNGCSKVADIPALKKKGHYPNANYRGSKSDLWDGGHRVPFIVRWPAGVKAGSSSDQLICLTDLMATCADLIGCDLPATAGEDSVSFAPALKGEQIISTRNGVIHHSVGGKFAYRQNKWKLILANDSGGWTKEPMPAGTVIQLYDMDADPEEQNNLYASHPEIAQKLLVHLKMDVKRGRSTDGPDLTNDVPVNLKTPVAGKGNKNTKKK